MEIQAVPDPSALAASAALRRILDRRAAGIGKVTEVVDAPAEIRAHLNLAMGRRLVRGRRRSDLITAATTDVAPAAVRYAAERQRFVDLLYRGEAAEPLLDDLRARFREPADADLLEAVRRSAEGFALSKLRELR
jgi:hypothetical protein